MEIDFLNTLEILSPMTDILVELKRFVTAVIDKREKKRVQKESLISNDYGNTTSIRQVDECSDLPIEITYILFPNLNISNDLWSGQ